MSAVNVNTANLEGLFDEGADVLDYFDTAAIEHLNCEVKRVNVDFPQWVVNELDKEAARIGVGRQAIIKTWIVERLDSMGKPA
ncbi:MULTISPECIES: type II toxin-antitoxin system BrnA family antitoxin [unclassified Adlercreutzia]|uniref:type II toxin-antitoxin system BrnA family antitoxin n=1 Tax=unclassified Adlercreutzia TaxID=2636013 RepID=UPI0013EBD5F6|nr:MULTISPECIES: CopG family transcriptional regulator [unclassified Adlercreutzia]